MLTALDVSFTRGHDLPGTPVTFDNDTIMTGFLNVMLFIDIEQDMLRFRATWRGQPTLTHSPTVLAAINEWNLTQITPRLSMTMDNTDTIIVHIYRRWPLGVGITTEQLDTVTRTSLGAITQCADWLDAQFPDLSDDWKE